MDILMLDEESVYAFRALYPGDIRECADATHISYGAFVRKKPVALAVLRMDGGELFVDWVFTLPRSRNKGVATELMEYVLNACEEAEGPSVVRAICPGDTIRGFFEKQGFVFGEKTVGISFVTELKKMGKVNLGDITSDNCSIADLDEKDMRNINNRLHRAGKHAFAVPLPVEQEAYSPLSRVSITQNKLRALILLKQVDEDMVDIAYVFKALGAEKQLVHTINATKQDLTKALSPKGKVRAAALNKAAVAVFEKLFPKAEREPIYMGERSISK